MKRVVKIGKKDLAASIFSNQYIIILLLLPYFKTSGFDFIPGLSNLCNIMLVVEFIVFWGICVAERRITPFGNMILILQIWIYFVAPAISGAEVPSLFYLVGALGMISFFELGFSRYPDRLMKAVCKLFTIMILINAVIAVVRPQGLIEQDDASLYLFGLRTGFSLFIIPGILFNLVEDKYNSKKKVWTVVTFFVGIFSILNQWVVTGLVELFVIIVMLVLFKQKKIAEKVNFVWVTLFLLIVDVSMTVVGSQNKLMLIASAIFNKDITFTGRTEIWSKVVQKLMKSPIAGFGLDATVKIGLSERSAHNQWLHIAMEGGYVAMVLLGVAVITSAIYLYRNRKSKWYTACAACMLATLVGTITEIQTYVPFFYIVFELPYLLIRRDMLYGVSGELYEK